MASSRSGSASELLGAAGAEQQVAPDEAALVQRAQRGDARALRELYDRYRPRVHAVASTVASLGAEAVQGVIRESFVRAFRRLPREGEADTFGPRLLATARRRALWSGGGTLVARRASSAGPEEGNDIEFARIRRAARPRPLRGRWIAAACATLLLLAAGGVTWWLARSSPSAAGSVHAQGPTSSHPAR